MLAVETGSLDEGEIQVIGLGAKDSPVEAATHVQSVASHCKGPWAHEQLSQAKTVLWDPARECPDSHQGGACKDAVGLANAYERGRSSKL